MFKTINSIDQLPNRVQYEVRLFVEGSYAMEGNIIEFDCNDVHFLSYSFTIVDAEGAVTIWNAVQNPTQTFDDGWSVSHSYEFLSKLQLLADEAGYKADSKMEEVA